MFSGNIKATCDQEKSNELPKDGRKETSTSKSPAAVQKSLIESSIGCSKKNIPLYTSIGSRKNLLELAGKTAEGSILNTPKKTAGGLEKLSLPQPQKSPSFAPINCQGLPKSQKYDVPQKPRAVDQAFLEKREKSNFKRSDPAPSYLSNRASNATKIVKDSCSQTKENKFSGLSKPSGLQSLTDAQVNSGYMFHYLESPVLNQNRPMALQFPALSPSAKYNSDNTPTPPMRENHFVRNSNNSKLPRRKFSILRDQVNILFESFNYE